MIIYNKETPILLVVSGFIENIRRIINIFEQIEPKRLYLYFDAPEYESQAAEYVKIESIFKEIKWKCIIKTLRNKTHLGYDETMLKAAKWLFRNEEEGIVLDDRNIPFPAFFAFCSNLLEKYRYDERIGHISCNDFLKSDKKKKTNNSYYFSKLINVSSGWASWQRVWKDMGKELKTFAAFKKLNIIENIPTHKPFRFHWHVLEHIDKKWEFDYEYINLINNRLSVVPDIRNISLKDYELLEIIHPKFMVNPATEELKFQEKKYQFVAITPNKPDGMEFLNEKMLLFNTDAGKRIKIPQIIHQIYEDPDGPPANLLHIAESWKELMPNWEYRFWNRTMINNFLETTCQDFLEYYHAYKFNVQRWDAIRYLILYHIGGLYVDFDYECIRPLDVLLTDSTCCMGMEPTINSIAFNKSLTVGNALMASVPKHPYMAAIIEDMKTNFHVDYRKKDSLQIIESTGPFMVTRVYERLKQKKSVTLLPVCLVTPLSIKEVWMLRSGNAPPDVIKKVKDAFAIHYFMGSWSPQTNDWEEWQKKMNK